MKVSGYTANLKKNYHQTFEIRKDSRTIVRHTLLLNPQSLTQNEQARANVTQTLGGAYVTDFGSGLPAVTIAGTTGYSQRFNADGEARDGWQEFKHFRNEIYRNFIETNDPDYAMFWYNWEDEEYYQIQPTSFRLQRSVSEPLLYRYEFAFTCIAKASVSSSQKPTNTFVNFAKLQGTALVCISNLVEVRNRFIYGR